MKELSFDCGAVRTRNTVSDLKMRKLLQLGLSEINRINKTYKIPQQAKIMPIVEITGMPIKPEIVTKQMVLGRQTRIKAPFLKLQTIQNSNDNLQNPETKPKTSVPRILQSSKTQTQKKSVSNKKLEEQLFEFKEEESLQKLKVRPKTLPKIQSQSKTSTVRQQKIERPLLIPIDPNLKNIKSLHYHIIQHQSKAPIISYRSKTKIQVASLTKIMTFYTVIQICKLNNINIQTEVLITQEMTAISGTTASLEDGQIYTIQQLLYGMMLPSGNDASLALAIYLGKVGVNGELGNGVKNFVDRMNLEAKELKMWDSSFANPHGLPHRNSRTTCEDIARLCSACLEIQLFRKVVSTKIYKFMIYDGQLKRKVAFEWQNTHKLLRRPGFIGIKTGITVTAGPCLASAYKFLDKTYIVVLAKCNKPSRRFKQTRKLLAHCLQRMDHGRPLIKEQQRILKKLSKSNEDLDSDDSQDQLQFNFDTFSSEEIQRRVKVLTQI